MGAKTEQSLKGTWTSFCVIPRIYSRLLVLSGHVETVCRLSKLHEAKHHVNVTLDMDELDLTSAESKATYEEIKTYVAERNDGMKVSNLYIAQVKAKYGIIERENYNKPKSDEAGQPKYWVVSVSDKIQWCRQARWVRDGKIYTSAGVSAGMDMSLGFIGDLYGMEQAEQIAQDIEYIWNK